jgi:hypothetical protein
MERDVRQDHVGHVLPLACLFELPVQDVEVPEVLGSHPLHDERCNRSLQQ